MRVLLQGLADLVHLLVDLRAVVVTVLTATRGLELDARRVPSANARDLNRYHGAHISVICEVKFQNCEFQKIVNRTITPQLLKWKGVEATQEISKSTNAKVIVIGNGDGDLPIILGGQQ